MSETCKCVGSNRIKFLLYAIADTRSLWGPDESLIQTALSMIERKHYCIAKSLRKLNRKEYHGMILDRVTVLTLPPMASRSIRLREVGGCLFTCSKIYLYTNNS